MSGKNVHHETNSARFIAIFTNVIRPFMNFYLPVLYIEMVP